MEKELSKRGEKKANYNRKRPKKQSEQVEPTTAFRFVEKKSKPEEIPAWKLWDTQYTIALKLNELIDKKELTLDTISKETEIKKSSMSCYTAGTAEPGSDAIKKLAQYLNVSSDYLLGLTDAPTTNPNERWAIEYTGISKEAYDIFHKGYNNKERPLYSQIVSTLIESKTIDNLVDLIERTLITQEQYKTLFGEDDTQRQNTLETLEYQFNKQISKMYDSIIDTLSKKLSREITNIAEQHFLDLIDGAIDTREKMEQIINETLSDPEKLYAYNMRYQEK